jgi:hypothetical protein
VWWLLCWHTVLTQEATLCTSLDCIRNSGHSPTVRDVLSQHRPCRSSEFTLLFAGPSSWCFMCFLVFMARYHVVLRMNPISLLKLSRCSWISMASFTNAVHAACHSCQYNCVPEVQSMLCFVAVFHHCWLIWLVWSWWSWCKDQSRSTHYSFIHVWLIQLHMPCMFNRPCLNGMAHLYNVHLAAFTKDTVNIWDPKA